MKTKVILEIQSEFEVYLESIQKAYPSIYAKQDVIQMLSGFVENITRWVKEIDETEQEKKVALGLTFEQRQELEGLLREAIERKVDRMDSSDVVNYDSAEFNIEYHNTLVLESVDFNAGSICDEIDEAISRVIGDFFQPKEELDTPYTKEM